MFNDLRLFTIFLTVVCAIFFSSCESTTFSGEFPDLQQVDTIEIVNSWDGLNPNAPFRQEYKLRRGEKSFSGSARFSQGRDSKTRREDVEDVEIPLEKVQSFLKKIAASPLKEGEYEPKIDHTDDYPYISISIATKSERVVVFSRSQGKDNIPWGMEFRGKTFVVESDSPSKALAELDPYLKQKTPLVRIPKSDIKVSEKFVVLPFNPNRLYWLFGNAKHSDYQNIFQ